MECHAIFRMKKKRRKISIGIIVSYTYAQPRIIFVPLTLRTISNSEVMLERQKLYLIWNEYKNMEY